MNEEDIKIALKMALKGDIEAYGTVVEALHCEIRGFCAMLGVRQDDLDDFCQEIFVTTYNTLSKFNKNSHFRPWIRGIARNIVRMYWVKYYKDRQFRENLSLEQLDPYASAESDWTQQIAESLAKLETCISRLPSHLSEILHRFYRQEQNTEQIALEMKRTPVSVRVTLMRTRTQLFDCIMEDNSI